MLLQAVVLCAVRKFGFLSFNYVQCRIPFTSHPTLEEAPPFMFKLVRKFKDCLTRQLKEAVILGGKPLSLNSKGEFGNCTIPRLTIEPDLYKQKLKEIEKRQNEEEEEKKWKELVEKVRGKKERRKVFPAAHHHLERKKQPVCKTTTTKHHHNVRANNNNYWACGYKNHKAECVWHRQQTE